MNENEEKKKKEEKKGYGLKDWWDGTEGRKIKVGTTTGRRNKNRSANGRRSKKRSIGRRKNGIIVVVNILVIVGILVCLLAGFRFGYSLLTLLLPLQSSISFLGILFFIIVILVHNNRFLDFHTIMPVTTSRPCTESPVHIKLGIRVTVFL